jgi:hypothetical protein
MGSQNPASNVNCESLFTSYAIATAPSRVKLKFRPIMAGGRLEG